jgi:hypothetical protein
MKLFLTKDKIYRATLFVLEYYMVKEKNNYIDYSKMLLQTKIIK